MNGKRQGKSRINVWLCKPTIETLRAEARSRAVPLQGLIEGAVEAMYRPSIRDQQEEVILRRLTLLDHRLQVLERLVEVQAESLAFFIRIWLASADLRDSQTDEGWRRGQQRYESYLRGMANRLREGLSIFTELPEDVVLKVVRESSAGTGNE